MLLILTDRQCLMHGHGIVSQATEVAATQLTSIRQLNTSELRLATDEEIVDECGAERLATPNVGLFAEGVGGVPPMLKDLACRHGTKNQHSTHMHGDSF